MGMHQTGQRSTTEFAGYDFNPYNNNSGLTFYGNISPSGILATGTPGTTAQARVLQFGDLISVTSPAVTGTPTGNDFPNGKTESYAYSSGFGDNHEDRD